MMYSMSTIQPHRKAFLNQDFLTEKVFSGHIIFFPSLSPENGPANSGNYASIDATQDVALRPCATDGKHYRK